MEILKIEVEGQILIKYCVVKHFDFFFFTSSYSFCPLFIKKNSQWLIFESIKASEIMTSMLYNLDFVNNPILSCFFLFFSIIDLCNLITAAIAQIFNPIAELLIPVRIPNKEAKTEIEIHPAIEEAK